MILLNLLSFLIYLKFNTFLPLFVVPIFFVIVYNCVYCYTYACTHILCIIIYSSKQLTK